MRTLLALIFTLLLLPIAALATGKNTYPFADPYKATVYGTPSELCYTFKDPVRPEVRAIRIEGRRVPDIFSYSRDMFFTTALQKGPAPLIFVIAGTGAEHNSSKMAFLTQLFHEAGFHVVALSSPTHMNFVASASEHGVPGYVPYDVADLNRVMGWIKEEVEKECKVTGYYLAGYSLGALHAAFLARMDDEQKDFNFQKVLMINPPVSLYRSVTRLDSWLTGENLGRVTIHKQIEEYIDKFSEYYLNADVTDLDDEFLYDMITNLNLDDRDLKTLIGASFRASSASMIFTSDVYLQAEYLVPPDQYPLKTSTPLLPYARQAFNISFEHYLDEYLLPFLQYMDPTMDRETLLRQSSLESIRPYLEKSDKIRVVGNRDDVILTKSDVHFLEEVFGDRIQLFPHGGHCGNMMYPAFVQAMIEVVKP